MLEAVPNPVPVFPYPRQVTPGTGSVSVTCIGLRAERGVATTAGKSLAAGLRRLGIATATGEDAGYPVCLVASQDHDASLGAEGYHLQVSATGAGIRGSAYAGLYYGGQTLLQLLEPQTDGATADIPLEYGVNIDPWNAPFLVGPSGDMAATIATCVYAADPVRTGQTADGKPYTVLRFEWVNPRPAAELRELRLLWGAGYTQGLVALLAVTAVGG
jgi:hypothetical protein